MFFIGIDDTDSRSGQCTTYIATKLAEKLSRYTVISELRLVRLNPTVPWKTRGNGAVAILAKEKNIEKLKKLTLREIELNAMLDDRGTNPGVVFYAGEIPQDFTDFYHRCLHRIVEIREAEVLAEKYGAEIVKYKNGRGIIGALAAIGCKFRDFTYELIAYRKKDNWGKKRRVDKHSVFVMNAKTYPFTFDNVDYSTNRVLITPNTPCPVLLGIRGEKVGILYQAFEMLNIKEPIDTFTVFKTNQATDVHLERVNKIKEIKEFSSVILRGRVKKKPRTIRGGHVFFELTDGKTTILCAAFEPTKDFRKIIVRLIPGDEIEVYGSVKKRTINLEKIRVIRLVRYEERNPKCSICGRSMESVGKGKGYRCKRCKTFAKEKVKVKINREIEEKFYEVPPAARGHLSKPLIRFCGLVA